MSFDFTTTRPERWNENLSEQQFTPAPAQPAPPRQQPPARKWRGATQWATHFMPAPLAAQQQLQSEGIPAKTGYGFDTYTNKSFADSAASGMAERLGIPLKDMGVYPVQVDTRGQERVPHPYGWGFSSKKMPMYNAGSLGPSRVSNPTAHPSRALGERLKIERDARRAAKQQSQ